MDQFPPLYKITPEAARRPSFSRSKSQQSFGQLRNTNSFRPQSTVFEPHSQNGSSTLGHMGHSHTHSVASSHGSNSSNNNNNHPNNHHHHTNANSSNNNSNNNNSNNNTPIHPHHFRNDSNSKSSERSLNARSDLSSTFELFASSSITSTAPPVSAFATRQKAYNEKEDINFWASLYARHRVHTRQDYDPLNDTSASSSSRGGDCYGPIKMWQVLTRTETDTDALFERLPIRVKSSQSSLSPQGKPFSIVFYFTVESTPATLWYMESAYTASRTAHEHMELMGTFQPNTKLDPSSFYIYETHVFNIIPPSVEDTMLELRVQSPSGSIYAEFAYTFVNDPHRPLGATSASTTNSATTSIAPASASASPTTQSISTLPFMTDNTQWPPSISQSQSMSGEETGSQASQGQQYDGDQNLSTSFASAGLSGMLEGELIQEQQALMQEQEQEQEQEHEPKQEHEHQQQYQHQHQLDKDQAQTQTLDQLALSAWSQQPAVLQSPDQSLYHEDEQDSYMVEPAGEEPDAGEHFIQATSEFFSKMGYWLYNSRMVQYIARDDRVRTKTAFSSADIWLLGIRYEFQDNELSITIPDAPRSRRGALFLPLESSSMDHTSRNVDQPLRIEFGSNTKTYSSSTLGFYQPDLPKAEGRRGSHQTYLTPRAQTDLDAIVAFSNRKRSKSPEIEREGHHHLSLAARQREKIKEREAEKEIARAKKEARAREREIEKEHERQEKAREMARAKEMEKERSRLKQQAKLRAREIERERKRQTHSLSTGHLTPVRTDTGLTSPTSPNSVDASQGYANLHPFGHGIPDELQSEAKSTVLGRMRTMSIIHRAASHVDLNQSRQQSQVHTLSSRSKSISNIAAFAPRSTTLSSMSSRDTSSTTPTTGSLSSSSTLQTMGMQDHLAQGPRHSVISKLVPLNLSQKRLPSLPHNDELPELPSLPSDEDEEDLVSPTPAPSLAPVLTAKENTVSNASSSSESRKDPRRRMTISGIFSRDQNGEKSTLSNMLSQLSPSKIPNKFKDAVAQKEIPRSDSDNLIAMQRRASALAMDKEYKEKDLTPPKKVNNPKAVYHWLEKRASSHNLSAHKQQVFVASTDEPVPVIRTASPELVDDLSADYERISSLMMPSAPLSPKKERTRKKSSIFSTSGSTSPKSVLKNSSPPLISPRSFARSPSPQLEPGVMVFDLTAPMTSSRPSTPNHIITSNYTAPPLQDIQERDSLIVVTLPPKENGTFTFDLHPMSPEKTTIMMDMVQLPSLPPESPTEAFVLLDQPEEHISTSMELEEPLIMTASRMSSEALYFSARAQSSIPETSQPTSKPALALATEDIAAALGGQNRDERLSDLRTDWEALWPSNPKIHSTGLNGDSSTAGFVHVQESEPRNSEPTPPSHSISDLHQPERIRGEERSIPKVVEFVPTAISIEEPKPRTMANDIKARRSQMKRMLSLPPPQAPVSESSDSVTSSPISPVLPSPSRSFSNSLRAAASRSLPRPLSGTFQSGGDSMGKRSSLLSTSTAFNPFQQPQQHQHQPQQPQHSFGQANSSFQPQSQRVERWTANQKVLHGFLLDFQSKLWFTYRKEIARIEPSFYTSDAGWGCMMRTGQSLLAHAFTQILLGRHWRIHDPQSEESLTTYQHIIHWFMDEPDNYYSIHNIAKSGLSLDKRVGEWFGPSTMAHALKRLSQKHTNCPLTVLVSMDTHLRRSQIEEAARVDEPVLNPVATPLEVDSINGGTSSNHAPFQSTISPLSSFKDLLGIKPKGTPRPRARTISSSGRDRSIATLVNNNKVPGGSLAGTRSTAHGSESSRSNSNDNGEDSTTDPKSPTSTTTPTLLAPGLTPDWKPVILLLPARFGLEKFTDKYSNNLKRLFRLPQFLGIAGGRPGRSLYFVACQGNELFYFDPHFVKPKVGPEEQSQCPAPSLHCTVVRSMDISEIDPSMLLGFLIKSKQDLDDLCDSLKEFESKYPLLTIQDDRPPSEQQRRDEKSGVMPQFGQSNPQQQEEDICKEEELVEVDLAEFEAARLAAEERARQLDLYDGADDHECFSIDSHGSAMS